MAVLSLVALAAAGTTGVAQYVRTYWLYRGFAPPSVPREVVVHLRHGTRLVKVPIGTEQVINIGGAAIGSVQPAFVFLPPGYFSHKHERYPVFYMLHGSPGGAVNISRVVDLAQDEEVLIAERRVRPMIIVAPTGSPGTFSDTEWANGVHPHSNWMTYMTVDVVDTIDRLYRAIPSGADRAIAGLSEGGYGALNIALHHPHEFRVIESWSGYMTADPVKSVWGTHPSKSLLADNSPALEVRRKRAEILRNHTFIWFYCGSDDPLLRANERFAAELRQLGVPYRFGVEHGGHSWRLWRSMGDASLIVASEHLAHG